MISTLIPTEATHSPLDLLKKALLIVTFENALTHKIDPFELLDCLMLEFEVMKDINQLFLS